MLQLFTASSCNSSNDGEWVMPQLFCFASVWVAVLLRDKQPLSTNIESSVTNGERLCDVNCGQQQNPVYPTMAVM